MPDEKPEPENAENFRWEYREVATSHRFYVGLRFIIAAFTATLQSALLKLYSDALIPVGPVPNVEIFGYQFVLGSEPLSITIVGALTMLATFFMERRNIRLFMVMINRGRKLESKLLLPRGQFSRLSKSRGFRFVTYTWSLMIIYSVIGGMWLYLLVLNFVALCQRNFL